ncbi:phage tail tape measure protein [Enterococcus faecalis]|nr:phage tail tape measure protein [Enterococcus faecalis]MCV5997126.1 phage tail tape measure protein [Enterococcus faecalis]
MKSIIDQSVNVSKELKDVERLLKLNPNNVELLSQKQELLSRQIELTTNKLDALKGAQADVERQFKSGEIGEEQYRKFKREIEATEGALNGYKGQLSSMKVEQEKLAQNTQRLSTFFEATGTDINDFSDVLGTRLVAAIKEGKANSSQLENALNKIGRAALGQTADINKMKQTLDSIDDGNSVQKISSDLNGLKSDANKADDALDKIGDTLEEIDDKIGKGNLLDAGEALSGISDKAKDMAGKTIEAFTEVEDAQKKLNASMGVAGTASAKKYEQALTDVFRSGLFEDMSEAADAVALVSKNLGDMSNQDLSQLVQDAKVLENTFEVDLKETIRGVAAMQENYGITGKHALDMITVALQRNGSTWADEVGDNMAEYSQLWAQMGFTASETFQILENGTRNGAYNLDKVNDVVKEIGISLTDGRIEENIDSFSQKSKELFESFKNGGASQAEVIQSLLTDLGEMENETEALSLASTVWSALGEDNSLKVLTSLMSVKGGYEDVQGAADKLNEDTTTTSQKMQGAWNDLKLALVPIGEELALALQPLLLGLTEILKSFQNLPGPVKTFIAAFLGVGTIVGILAGVAGALTALVGILGGPVTLALIAVTGIIAGVIAVIKNWGSITEWFSKQWDRLQKWWTEFWARFSDPADSAFKILSSSVKTVTSFLFGSFEDKVNAVKNIFKSLRLKFPKIELPPMPHFDLKWSSKKIFGKNISYPSGIDVKWFADGGILTKPTIFGASGNKLLGGGEAGKEAVAPLDKLMGYIQTAVDKSLSKQQTSDEIHLHLTAYGNLPKETLDQIAEYLTYKFVDLKNKEVFGG